jgi:hypothetical protein
MQAPFRSILIQYGGLTLNTQMIEHGNKNHNICASHSREGRAVNAWITCQSVLVDITSTTTVDKKHEASSGWAHMKSIFHKLDVFTAAEQECQRWMTTQEYWDIPGERV